MAELFEDWSGEEIELPFRVADNLYGVNIAADKEVLHAAATAQLPGQPPILHGMLNLRGESIPVIDLNRTLHDVRAPVTAYSPIVVLRTAGKRFAILACSTGSLQEGEEAQESGQSHAFNDRVEGTIESDAGPVQVLSVDRILLTKEWSCVASLQAHEQKRIDRHSSWERASPPCLPTPPFRN